MNVDHRDNQTCRQSVVVLVPDSEHMLHVMLNDISAIYTVYMYHLYHGYH